MTRSLFGSLRVSWLLALALTAGATLQPAAPAHAQAAAADADLFKVPDGDAKQIEDFMKKLAQTEPQGETDEEKIDFSIKALNALVEASTRLLAAKPTDDQAAQAYAYKLEALQALIQMDQTEAVKKFEEALAAARDDKRDDVIGLGWQNTIMYTTNQWPELDPKQQQAFLDLIVNKVKAGPAPIDVSIVQVTSMRLDGSADQPLAKMLEQVIPILEQSKDEKVQAKLAEANLPGILRRLTLLGNPMEISGTLLDGKEVDWASYRGKVVLVDFWATWCGPCRAEIPNVLEMYEAYHDKGFDVLGISLDATPEAAKKYVDDNKLPWQSIFPKNEDEREWQNPLVSYYGITGIPTAILVGKDGKVVNMNARGPVLGEELEKLLGPPAEKKEAAAK